MSLPTHQIFPGQTAFELRDGPNSIRISEGFLRVFYDIDYTYSLKVNPNAVSFKITADTKEIVTLDAQGNILDKLSKKGVERFIMEFTGLAAGLDKKGKRIFDTNPSAIEKQKFLGRVELGNLFANGVIPDMKTLVAHVDRIAKERDKELGDRGKFSKDDFIAHFMAFLEDYGHVDPGFVYLHPPARNTHDFIDITGVDHGPLDYEFRKHIDNPSSRDRARGRKPKCKPYRFPPNLNAPMEAKFTAGFCSAPNPIRCRDTVLGQGMPTGFTPDDKLTCRFAFPADQGPTPEQAIALSNCRNGECLGQNRPGQLRMANPAKHDELMARFCSKVISSGVDDCPIDPKTGVKSKTCPNAVRTGNAGLACRKWQKEFGGVTANNAFVKLCERPEHTGQSYCDCIAGSLPKSREHALYKLMNDQPFFSRQSDKCWFGPCGNVNYTLQTSEHLNLDPSKCDVSCTNIINVLESSNVNLANVKQVLNCNGKEISSVIRDNQTVTGTVAATNINSSGSGGAVSSQTNLNVANTGGGTVGNASLNTNTQAQGTTGGSSASVQNNPASVVGGGETVVSAPPPPPSSFTGTVTQGGSNGVLPGLGSDLFTGNTGAQQPPPSNQDANNTASQKGDGARDTQDEGSKTTSDGGLSTTRIGLIAGGTAVGVGLLVGLGYVVTRSSKRRRVK